MLMDPMGGIVMTNDGNAILREVRLLSISRLSLHLIRKSRNDLNVPGKVVICLFIQCF